jgi:hypothetical protein
MAMVDVRIMGMFVHERRVRVGMNMRSIFLSSGVVVFVMIVMHMKMFVCMRFVFVIVPFCNMEPKPYRHKRPGGQQRSRHRFSEHGNGQDCTDKGRGRKVGAGARRPEMTQCIYEQGETRSIA